MRCYEITGFERSTMTRIDGRVNQVELAFPSLRKAIKSLAEEGYLFHGSCPNTQVAPAKP